MRLRKVVSRLAHLNELYCTIFPDMRFITFVNGRSRAAIIPDFEAILGLPISPDPLSDDAKVDIPPLNSEEMQSRVHAPESKEWKVECKRGLKDVFLIARARLKGLGLQ